MSEKSTLQAIFNRLPPPQRRMIETLLREHSEHDVVGLARAITAHSANLSRRKPGRPPRDRDDLLRDMAVLMVRNRSYKPHRAAREACRRYADGEDLTFAGITTALDSMIRGLIREWRVRGKVLIEDARHRIASENRRRGDLNRNELFSLSAANDDEERRRLAEEAFGLLRRELPPGLPSAGKTPAGFELHPQELALLKDGLQRIRP